jgi:hypothetical protein
MLELQKVAVSWAIIQGECRLLLDVVIGKCTACPVEKLTWRKEAVSQPGIQEECQASTPSGTVLSIPPTVEGFYSAGDHDSEAYSSASGR